MPTGKFDLMAFLCRMNPVVTIEFTGLRKDDLATYVQQLPSAYLPDDDRDAVQAKITAASLVRLRQTEDGSITWVYEP